MQYLKPVIVLRETMYIAEHNNNISCTGWKKYKVYWLPNGRK